MVQGLKGCLLLEGPMAQNNYGALCVVGIASYLLIKFSFLMETAGKGVCKDLFSTLGGGGEHMAEEKNGFATVECQQISRPAVSFTDFFCQAEIRCLQTDGLFDCLSLLSHL